MKVLIDSKYRAVMKGEFVRAHEERGEAVISSDDDITVAVLKEIAHANKLDIVGLKKKDEIHNALFNGLSNLEINEVTKQTDSDKATQIVKEGLEAGKSEDAILVDIVNAGIKFGAAMRYYNAALKETGMYTSPKERKEQIANILKELDFAPESYTDVQNVIRKITDEVDNTNDKQALAGIRAWCKDNEVELPKRSGGGNGAGRTSLRTRAMEMVLSNPGIDYDEFKTWVVDKQDGKEKHAENFWSIVEFARKYAEVSAN